MQLSIDIRTSGVFTYRADQTPSAQGGMHRHRDLLSLLWQKIAGKPCSMTVAAKAESVSKPGAANDLAWHKTSSAV
jgi:hypothetical protein